jgi:hypothetical protein
MEKKKSFHCDSRATVMSWCEVLVSRNTFYPAVTETVSATRCIRNLIFPATSRSFRHLHCSAFPCSTSLGYQFSRRCPSTRLQLAVANLVLSRTPFCSQETSMSSNYRRFLPFRCSTCYPRHLATTTTSLICSGWSSPHATVATRQQLDDSG